ncbi:MAG: hypothetical protein V3U22_02675 [Vicinamibacteria bacterium]
MALVIAHITEMSRRKGHLERGYKNLFDYCVRARAGGEGDCRTSPREISPGRDSRKVSLHPFRGVAFIQEKIDASRRKPSPNGLADSS